MEKTLMDFRLFAKQMEMNSKKCKKQEKLEQAKVKKAIQQGRMEVAKIHAENAIRNKVQEENYLRMAARVDAVASRVQTAVSNKDVARSMGSVVKSMTTTMQSMNLEKVSTLMDSFERQFENLDVQSATMDAAMHQTVATNVPQQEVDQLMSKVADEAGIELSMEFPSGQRGELAVSSAASTVSGASSTATEQQDELSLRLAQLRR